MNWFKYTLISLSLTLFPYGMANSQSLPFHRLPFLLRDLNDDSFYGTAIPFHAEMGKVYFFTAAHIVRDAEKKNIIIGDYQDQANVSRITVESVSPGYDLAIISTKVRDLNSETIVEQYQNAIDSYLPSELQLPLERNENSIPSLYFEGILLGSHGLKPNAISAHNTLWAKPHLKAKGEFAPLEVYRTTDCPQLFTSYCYRTDILTFGFSGGPLFYRTEAGEIKLLGILTHFEPGSPVSYILPIGEITKVIGRMFPVNSLGLKDMDGVFESNLDATQIQVLKTKEIWRKNNPLPLMGGGSSMGGGGSSMGGGGSSGGLDYISSNIFLKGLDIWKSYRPGIEIKGAQDERFKFYKEYRGQSVRNLRDALKVYKLDGTRSANVNFETVKKPIYESLPNTKGVRVLTGFHPIMELNGIGTEDVVGAMYPIENAILKIKDEKIHLTLKTKSGVMELKSVEKLSEQLPGFLRYEGEFKYEEDDQLKKLNEGLEYSENPHGVFILEWNPEFQFYESRIFLDSNITWTSISYRLLESFYVRFQ